MGNLPAPERILADASNSTGGLGKIGTVAATTGTLLVRYDNVGFGRTAHMDWRVKSDQAFAVTAYRSRTDVTGATITLADATAIDDGNTFILNGLTYTAEDTATDAAWASRKYYTGGADAAADAVQIAALINADYTIVPNGSVSVGDTITIVTKDSEHGEAPTTYTYTAAATPDYPNRVFDQSGNQAAELASIVLAINHRRNVTCASVTAGQTVTIQRGMNGASYTYTAHADTTSGTEFSISGNDAADATELAVAINTQTATHGYVATAVGAAVHIARNAASVPEPILTSSSATLLACVNTAGGVPGVVAVATGATGELGISPVWVKRLTVTTSNDTRLDLTDIDIPGVYAVASSGAGTGIVTLSCTTPGSPAGCEKATCLQFAQGTSDANEAAWSETTLASLVAQNGVAWTGVAANSTTAGTTFEQWVDGWDYAYLKFANGAGSAATITVAATAY